MSSGSFHHTLVQRISIRGEPPSQNDRCAYSLSAPTLATFSQVYPPLYSGGLYQISSLHLLRPLRVMAFPLDLEYRPAIVLVLSVVLPGQGLHHVAQQLNSGQSDVRSEISCVTSALHVSLPNGCGDTTFAGSSARRFRLRVRLS
jgi:hypothetical protein